MKRFFDEAELLVQEAQEISNELWKYNPSLNHSKKVVPITAIAHSIAGLMYRFAALRVDIINKDKENEI